MTEMEGLSILWYFCSLSVLIVFFIVIACSSNPSCRIRLRPDDVDEMQQQQAAKRRRRRPTPPQTPAPSYSEFAPPSYETAIANRSNIFVIYIDEKPPVFDKAPTLSPRPFVAAESSK